MDVSTQSTPSTLRRIGQGACGSVWAALTLENEYTEAIKREDGGLGRSLPNDYRMHQKILDTFSSSPSRARVPRCHLFVYADDTTWWETQLPRFPEKFQVPCHALVTDRIPPFNRAAREALIDRYCPEPLRASIKSSELDHDCLVRPYLGRRRRRRLERMSGSGFNAFTLRNYPLHLDQVEELGLDAPLYARTMANTLAELFWRAHVDANDVKFVLAPPRHDYDGALPPSSPPAIRSTIKSEVLGDHVVWLLDFDCCRNMSMDEAGVAQAVKAFLWNDPFYPRPGHSSPNDAALWTVFKENFLKTSAGVLGEGSPESRLPRLWIDQVERMAQSQTREMGTIA